jgi:hypothetical protein
MENFPILCYENQQIASNQLADYIAQHVTDTTTNERAVICTDDTRNKFYVLDDEKWIEDIGKQKTVKSVCKTIIDHFGATDTFIDKLIDRKRQELNNDVMLKNSLGISTESELQNHLIKYEADVRTTVYQILACSRGSQNSFSKNYLKRLAKLVRGTKEQREKVRKLI